MLSLQFEKLNDFDKWLTNNFRFLFITLFSDYSNNFTIFSLHFLGSKFNKLIHVLEFNFIGSMIKVIYINFDHIINNYILYDSILKINPYIT